MLPKRMIKLKKQFLREWEIWLLTVPIILWVLLFAYVPMTGLAMAFFNYVPGQPIFENEFVGLRWLGEFFHSPEFMLILRNTLVISGLNILIGFPAPIILALALNELQSRPLKKASQTLSYLPYFISWVVAASMITTFLSSDGLVNSLLLRFGLTDTAIPFLTQGRSFWVIITGANLWKGIGWSSIIYLSAMAGVDENLYDAGLIDGLGRFGMMRHITIPSIMVTIIFLWILSLGNILNAGFEQQLLLGKDQNREYWDVIDTYAYRYGIQWGRWSYATAVGLLKGLIALVLVLGTNTLARKKTGVSLI